ncbi:MAG: hypothetical protein R3C62_06870 [Chloroflexota bacterium]
MKTVKNPCLFVFICGFKETAVSRITRPPLPTKRPFSPNPISCKLLTNKNKLISPKAVQPTTDNRFV